MVAEGQSDRMGPDMEVQMKQRCVLPAQKKKKEWHPVTFINACEHLWRPNHGCEHSEVMGGDFLQGQQGVNSTHADFYEQGIQALVHHWQKWLTNSSNYVEKLLCS